jgi:hypothetical protein
MLRTMVTLSLALFSMGITAQNAPSDSAAVALAQRSMAALAGRSSVDDVTLQAEVHSTIGADPESGTGTFRAKGLSQSRVDLSFGGDTQSDTRNMADGARQKNGAAAKAHAGHNCMTDAAWFFPALSSLTQSGNPSFVFKYIGEEEYASVNTLHIRVSQIFPQDKSGVLERLSAMDFYLDAASSLPVAITFQTHPDNDLNVNIITEVHFSDYRTVNGILIPFSFQQMLNGRVILEATVTSAEVNASLPDSHFTLQ